MNELAQKVKSALEEQGVELDAEAEILTVISQSSDKMEAMASLLQMAHECMTAIRIINYEK